ncbi:MAG TPA: PQQ-dependent sugar dehydrogenase [Aggregatilineaceae bacterium]|nr:PQQ-dependent sugar dehydrogenase [Aggregatilineaceae bacterium]
MRRVSILLIVLLPFLSACESETPQVSHARPFTLLKAEGPPCHHIYWGPYHNIHEVCIEVVYDHVTPPEAVPALDGLAFATDGTLYFVRPAFGEIWQMQDANGDGYMDDPTLYADGLTRPTRLALHENVVFIAAMNGVFRLDDPAADPTLLIPNLPIAGIAIGPDNRLYVGVSAGCNACRPTDPRLGTLLSYALDGTDERFEATGLRYPADFDWNPTTGELWIADQGIMPSGTGLDGPPDELNLFEPGANYGFPASDPGGADTALPRFTFPSQSGISSIAFYPSDAFPMWQDDLIVALGGSWNRVEPSGYLLTTVGFTNGAPNGNTDPIAPTSAPPEPVPNLAGYSLSGRGFYPYHPSDITISADGWIYLSVQEGRIFRFRPRPAAES